MLLNVIYDERFRAKVERPADTDPAASADRRPPPVVG
jgi:hypothetical protein